jgi:hypothetical protein
MGIGADSLARRVPRSLALGDRGWDANLLTRWPASLLIHRPAN